MTKILIVDDDKFLLDMYAKKFGLSGFEVQVASGAEEALTLIKDGLKVDVLLSDITMPGIDGFEFVEKINEENLIPEASKIMLTNQNMDADIERSKKLGVDGYIVKATMIPSEVVNEVEEILKAKKEKNGI